MNPANITPYVFAKILHCENILCTFDKQNSFWNVNYDIMLSCFGREKKVYRRYMYIVVKYEIYMLVVPVTCSQKLINYLAFQPFKLELTWARLFQKRVVRTNFVCVLEKKVEKSLCWGFLATISQKG
jgi:hypothetical protein